MRARDCFYHVQCFQCIICSSPLQPGEYFALGDAGSLYCQAHYEPLLAMSSDPAAAAPVSGGSLLITAGTGHKGRPKKKSQNRQSTYLFSLFPKGSL